VVIRLMLILIHLLISMGSYIMVILPLGIMKVIVALLYNLKGWRKGGCNKLI